MILISALPRERMLSSACTESIILSEGSTKQKSTKSCSGKCGNDGSGRGDSGGGNRFGVGGGDDDCSDDSNSNGNGDNHNCNGDSGNDDSNSGSGSGDRVSSGKNNYELNK
jgi:hypothetical protein